jgi:hypothetical protein
VAEVKQAVIRHLMNTPVVVTAFANRITADKIPDNQTYPHARVWVVTSPQGYHHQGESGRQPLVQIDVFDDDVAGADTYTELIRSALSGYRGMMGSLNAGAVFVNPVSGMWNEETRSYRRILEVRVLTND